MNIREHIGEFFPESLFFDTPVNDDSIIGISLIYDDGPTWVVTYGEEETLSDLEKYFSTANEPTEEAIQWFDQNILGTDLGHQTPVFIHTHFEQAYRYNTFYENILTTKSIISIKEAIDIVEKDHAAIFFVSFEELEFLNELV